MVYIEVTKMRPLDVVLMTGTRIFSKVILAASSLAAMRQASYSHATLMLSQSMCVEALDGVATVLTDYATPQKLACRWVRGKLAVFIALEAISDALVLRHKSISEDGRLALLFRGELLLALSELYLRQYSKLSRLLKPVVCLPAPVMRLIERVTTGLDGFKPEPGPFCSELVCRLLEAVPSPTRPPPDAVSPSALEWVDDFLAPLRGERSPVHTCSLTELPGEPADDMAKLLVEMLSTGAGDTVQHIRGSTLKVMTLVPKLVGGQSGCEGLTDGLEDIYAEMRRGLRRQWIDELGTSLSTFSDPVWEWIARSNACMETCPAARQEFFPPKSLWPRRMPGFMTSLEASELRLYGWDGARCRSTCDCAMASLPRLQGQISEARELLMQSRQAEADEAIRDL